MRCNTGGMTKKIKETRLNVRIDEDIREDFHITAKLRGGNAASLIRNLIIREVREEKKLHSKEQWESMRQRMAEFTGSVEVASDVVIVPKPQYPYNLGPPREKIRFEDEDEDEQEETDIVRRLHRAG